jgi:hypothetical protein
MSLMGRLHREKAKLSEGESDPWRRALERALPANLACISTVALLDLLGFQHTTGNARRLAPGGWRTTECRGWARPLREIGQKDTCHGS